MAFDLELAQMIGESADRLVSTQVFMSGGSSDRTTRNVTRELYDAARRIQRDPLVYLAARALLERVKPRDPVLICSGFFDPPSMIGEADGPLGAALFGRALCVALDATPVFLTEVTHMPRMAALAQAAGLEVLDFELARTTPFKVSVLPLPIEHSRAATLAKQTFDRVQPVVMVSIEKPSPSRAGTYHTGAGLDVTGVVGKIDHFVNEAQSRGILSIGVGDGGNEVGMGLILDEVLDIIPTGKIIAASARADILVVAAVANWGSYAIEACLAAALHKPDVLHSLADERRLTEAAALAGLIDPATGLANGWVDGTPPVCSESMLELLRQMVDLRLAKRRPEAQSNFSRHWLERGGAEETVRIWAKKLSEEENAFFS